MVTGQQVAEDGLVPGRSAVEILTATLDALRNEPTFVVENRKERRARIIRQRRRTK